jgi:RNA polymerase sigma-70 factor, ECF subfamily
VGSAAFSLSDEDLASFRGPAPDSVKKTLESFLEASEIPPTHDTLSVSAFLRHLARHTEGDVSVVANVRASDLWLAYRCSIGDAQALTVFHARYDDDIRRALKGVRVVGMDVDDLAQELARRMFVGALPKIAEYSGRGDLRAWVRIVATRLSLDLVRIKKNTADTPTDDSKFGTLAVAAKSQPDEAYFRRVYRKEVAQAIEQAAKSLDSEERNALREHYARGLSVDQIAAIHGIHRATAARRVQKARESLISAVKRILDETHGLRGRDLASVMGLVRSQLHLTMDRLLGSA